MLERKECRVKGLDCDSGAEWPGMLLRSPDPVIVRGFQMWSNPPCAPSEQGLVERWDIELDWILFDEPQS